ncbi:hypothetical protein ADIS_3848 [Lunatimonas lonarensis]|uniref:Uncharacterized protein n=1 Tax=Lunatimonas lonarensis TaxID=1232681 RepID=R7ZNR4_9BACT|nr:hypothetical protein ADIS_3848 [Lunatimonas lonarensis]
MGGAFLVSYHKTAKSPVRIFTEDLDNMLIWEASRRITYTKEA